MFSSTERSYVFSFSPAEYLPPSLSLDDKERFCEELYSRGSLVFSGLHAWRLRLDARNHNPHYAPWAVELPLEAFVGFQEGSEASRFAVERRNAVLAKAQEANPLKKDLLKGVFIRRGVTYYRADLLYAMAQVAGEFCDPTFFFAYHEFLREATKNPGLITGKRYTKSGNIARRRTATPVAARKDGNGRNFRGPNWTPEEDKKLRVFFKSGYALTESQFERQQQQLLLAGQPVPLMRTTLPAWQKKALEMLNNNRTLPAIIQRVQILNARTRKKYAVRGRIPPANREAFSQEFLGFWHDANHYNGARKLDAYWRVYLRNAAGLVAVVVTKTPALSVGTLNNASPDPLTLVAFERCNDDSIPVAIVSDLHGGVWYRATPAVEAACAAASEQMHRSLRDRDVTYRATAKLLRRWLPSSLVMLALDSPSA